jgi:glyoxylase-like metal-dependent hydrolase (beta-lactamase superfamily II)
VSQQPVGRHNLPVADPWWEVVEVADGIHRLVEPHVDDLLRSNVWLLRGRDRDLLVDAGMGVAPLAPVVAGLTPRPVLCAVTHTHSDHVGGWAEFSDRRVHALEADALHPEHFSADMASLQTQDWSPDEVAYLRSVGYAVNPLMIRAVPSADFDIDTWTLRPAPATVELGAGDIIDLGDRQFEVVHVPGHTPGSIAFWEAATGTLCCGDMVYDGPLLDRLVESDVDDYVASMRLMQRMPVRLALPGHEQPLPADDFEGVVATYLATATGTTRTRS